METPLTVLRASHTAANGFDLIVEANCGAALWGALTAAGARPVGFDALEILRVEAGEPRFGVDMDETNVVSETGLDDSVSFTKGCYIGQEIIARIKYRGHVAKRLSGLLLDRGVTVKFAIHPVAGRMPGHMNVLLAEAGVPYDLISDLDEINSEFETADAALIIGANDVVNPVARNDKSSPIYGMPILNADKAKNVIVIKRGQGQGFSGIDNALFGLDQARMLYGDAQAAVSQLIQAVKAAG